MAEVMRSVGGTRRGKGRGEGEKEREREGWRDAQRPRLVRQPRGPTARSWQRTETFIPGVYTIPYHECSYIKAYL